MLHLPEHDPLRNYTRLQALASTQSLLVTWNIVVRVSSSIDIISIIKYHVMLSNLTHFITQIRSHIQQRQHQLIIILNTTQNTRIILEYIHSYYTPYIHYAMRLHICGTDYSWTYSSSSLIPPDTATKLTSPTHLRPSDSLTNSSPWELATTPRAMICTLIT